MTNIASMQTLRTLTDAEVMPEKAIVLIVDDEPLNRFLIAEALAADNYRIVEAESGEAAVEYVANHNVDLILLDIDMPGLGGLAACAAIRALPHGNLVPIAMVTGLDDNASIEHAFDCGATDFLTKPVNWLLMRQRVRFMLRYGSITQELQHNEQILEQVHEIAQIGHWQWDIVSGIVTHSELFLRLVPGIPTQISGITLGTKPSSEFGLAVFAKMLNTIEMQQNTFQQEFSIDIPGRGKRHFLNHGHIEYRDSKPIYAVCTIQDITERHRNEERYAAIFDASPVGILEVDFSDLLAITQQPDFADISEEQLRTKIATLPTRSPDNAFKIKANSAAQRMLAHVQQHAQLQALRIELLVNFLTAIRSNQRQMTMQGKLPQNSGEQRDTIISTQLPNTPEEYQRIVISFSDITDLIRREAQLKRADTIIANSRDSVCVMDKDKRVIAINPAFARTTGYTLEQVQTAGQITKLPDLDYEQTTSIIRETLIHQDYWRGEVELRCRNGSVVPAILQVQIFRDEQDEIDGYASITSDISHVKESERRLFQLAHFDALTGLPNRLSLQERLQAKFNSAADDNFCLLYIDLDGFKLVNDSMGHPTGDTVLQEVSARLSKSCRPDDLLARIGGDEFALLMEHGATHAAIDAQAERIFTALGTPFSIKERDLFIGASIGVCRYPNDAPNAEDMLRNADNAMYEAKNRGRGQLCYYSAELTRESDHRLQVENELRIAITSDQLFLAYQPKYDAASGAMLGAEALVRWRNPKRGIIPPGEFIGIAEATGLIVPLGEWVINEACRQIAEWQRDDSCSVPVAINISALHLREQSLLQVVRDAIARFDIDPQLLEIEITEDSLDFRGEDDKPYAMLEQLSALGLSIAIDDFGTGYSSLSQLKKMPISTLKIDMSFVRDIASSDSDHAIITAIVGLAKTLNMNVVAEGVENEEQACRLRSLKCNVLQGFLYSKPVPPTELLEKFLVQRGAPQ